MIRTLAAVTVLALSVFPSQAVELCNIKSLVLSIEKAVPPKTQFEKEAAFQKRAVEGYQAAGINGNDIVCEIGAVSDDPMVFSKSTVFAAGYDAERGVVTFRSDFFLGPRHEDRNVTRTYEASNKHGAKMKVEEGTVDVYGTVMDMPDIDITFPLGAKAAEERWDNLVIAIRFDIASPILEYERHTSEPTFDAPQKWHQTFRYLKAEPNALLLVDKGSNQILGEVSIPGS